MYSQLSPQFEAHTPPNGTSVHNSEHVNGNQAKKRRNVFPEPNFLRNDLTTRSERHQYKADATRFIPDWLREKWCEYFCVEQCVRKRLRLAVGKYIVLGFFHKGRVRPEESILLIGNDDAASWMFWRIWWKIILLRGVSGLFSLKDVSGFRIYRCVKKEVSQPEEQGAGDTELLELQSIAARLMADTQDGFEAKKVGFCRENSIGSGAERVEGIRSPYRRDNSDNIHQSPVSAAKAKMDGSTLDIENDALDTELGTAGNAGTFVFHESIAYLSPEDQHTLQLLFAAYASWRFPNGAGRDWNNWIQIALNNGHLDPTQSPEGKAYSLEIDLDWSSKRIIVALLAPLIVSLAVGLYIMNYEVPYEMETLEAAWSVASYAVTAGGFLAALLGYLTNVSM